MWAPRGLHQTAVWQYFANLAYGVTTTRDPQTSTPDVFAYADMVDAGMMPGPRVFATGPGVFSTSGIEDRDAAFRFIKRYKEAYRTNTIKQYVAGDRIVRQWIIEASREYGITPDDRGLARPEAEPDADRRRLLRPGAQLPDHAAPQGRGRVRGAHQDVLHADDPRRLRRAVEREPLVRDREHGRRRQAEQVDPQRAARHDDPPPAAVVRARGVRPHQLGKQVADIVHAGGRAGLGSHGQLQGLGAHWETWNLGSGGLTPHETLRVVTIFGAEAIGLQQDVGSLEPGKLADLVVLDANPLVNIRNTNTVRYVMKNGELFEADTLNTIWPAAKTLPKPFWWDTGPPESCARRRPRRRPRPRQSGPAGRAGADAATHRLPPGGRRWPRPSGSGSLEPPRRGC